MQHIDVISCYKKKKKNQKQSFNLNSIYFKHHILVYVIASLLQDFPLSAVGFQNGCKR